MTLLRYDVEKPESSFAQVRLIATKKEDEKFQHVVYVNYRLEEIIYLVDVMNSAYDKILLINPFVIFYKKYFHLFTLYLCFLIRVKMSWNIADNRNIFLKLKSKSGLYHVLLTTPETSPEKLTLTVLEMQQLPDVEKIDSNEEISCLK